MNVSVAAAHRQNRCASSASALMVMIPLTLSDNMLWRFPLRLVSDLGELVYLSQPASQHDAGRDRRHSMTTRGTSSNTNCGILSAC